LKEYFAARWLRDKNKLKKYLRQYYIKNKRILREKSKIYRMLNAKKIALMKKRYSQNNKDKANENHMLRYYDDLYNQRVIKNSQAYAKNHNQRGECCEKCGSKKRLQFHHTNYEKNIGMTLCIKCHVKLHRGVYYETGN
jgi:tRNA A22 N-methylase